MTQKYLELVPHPHDELIRLLLGEFRVTVERLKQPEPVRYPPIPDEDPE